ncbi:hypothetical protein [Pseudomonas kilonensis]|uniref:hypothetical protein n=1 Tax=Pseudomonas kilonensis TaxID=132476 RepID=UPI00209C8C13|nr:hypothetical protein [Pseudomonas kilonensis]MCP1454119.1 hypothetical protein [Pseudomonas kilonensis]
MSSSAIIVSDAKIDESAFSAFMREIGGLASAGKQSRGTVSHGEATLYLSLLRSGEFEEFYGEESILEWESLLGARPKTLIEIQLGHSKGSMKMYLWFAVKFGAVWGCILEDVNSVGLSYSAVCERYSDICSKDE